MFYLAQKLCPLKILVTFTLLIHFVTCDSTPDITPARLLVHKYRRDQVFAGRQGGAEDGGEGGGRREGGAGGGGGGGGGAGAGGGAGGGGEGAGAGGGGEGGGGKGEGDENKDGEGGEDKEAHKDPSNLFANRFTQVNTSTLVRRRTAPFRGKFEEQCDYIAKYCLKTYQTGRLCARTIYFNYQTFKNYCMMDYVNCRERYDVWQVLHMGQCYELKDITDYMHYGYNGDSFLDTDYVVDDQQWGIIG